MKNWSKLLVAGLAGLVAAKEQRVRDFAATNWTVTNEYGNITVPGKYPSHVHLDLYAAGVIGKSRSCYARQLIANLE